MIRKNGTYTILSSFPIPQTELEIVIARSDNYNEYVTWEYSRHNNSYYWGHYFKDIISALNDFCKRLTKEIEYMIDIGVIK